MRAEEQVIHDIKYGYGFMHDFMHENENVGVKKRLKRLFDLLALSSWLRCQCSLVIEAFNSSNLLEGGGD